MKTSWSLIVGRLPKALFAMALTLLVAGGAHVLRAQTPDTTQLRAQLAERYNVVPLQNGVALTPLKAGGTIRFIEVRDGLVAINGDTVSSRDLKQRLGDDANLILRVTYLDAAAMKTLAAGVTAGAPTGGGGDALDRAKEAAEQAERDRAAERITEREAARAARAAGDGKRSQERRGDIVRFGGSVTVGRDESVDGDAVAIGGSADIDGEVRGDVAAIGGSVNLGPESHVHGNIAVVGGSLNRAAGAQVDGKIDDVGVGPFGNAGGPWNMRVRPWSATFSRVGSLVATVVRICVLALVMLLVTALGARYVESISSRTLADPLRSGLSGLLTEFLAFPVLVLTCLVLVITIIGIPLLILVPFAIIFAIILALVGFTGVAHQVGQVVATRFGIQRGIYAQVMLGLAAIVLVSVLAKLIGLLGGVASFAGGLLTGIGYLIEYVAWTVGIGAVILTWLNMRRGRPMPGQAAAVPVNDEGLR